MEDGEWIMVHSSWRMDFSKAEVEPQRERSAKNENPALPRRLRRASLPPQMRKERRIWGGVMSVILEDSFGTRREVFRAKRAERLCGNSD
jgi:hypothetical protein